MCHFQLQSHIGKRNARNLVFFGWSSNNIAWYLPFFDDVNIITYMYILLWFCFLQRDSSNQTAFLPFIVALLDFTLFHLHCFLTGTNFANFAFC